MQELFYVAEFSEQGLKLVNVPFESYSDAVASITDLKKGIYQVQKVFKKI
jgi:hypothetical protein